MFSPFLPAVRIGHMSQILASWAPHNLCFEKHGIKKKSYNKTRPEEKKCKIKARAHFFIIYIHVFDQKTCIYIDNSTLIFFFNKEPYDAILIYIKEHLLATTVR